MDYFARPGVSKTNYETGFVCNISNSGTTLSKEYVKDESCLSEIEMVHEGRGREE